MIDAMIIDDEAPARAELRFLLEQTGKLGVITEASNARQAVEGLMEHKPDVLFMDISMPKTSGMQLAQAIQNLKKPPLIIFVTAYSEYAVDAFNVNAIDYLLKPVETDRLLRALEKAQEKIDQQNIGSIKQERITVEKNGKKSFIPIGDICYIKAKDDYACIYTLHDHYLSTTSLAQFEAKLTNYGFFRVHRGYIVNLELIDNIEALSTGVLKVGIRGIKNSQIPVSRRRVVALKRALGI